MKILVTGATGYIGKRLIPFLLNEGHTVVCVVRDRLRADKSFAEDENVYVIEADFLKPETLKIKLIKEGNIPIINPARRNISVKNVETNLGNSLIDKPIRIKSSFTGGCSVKAAFMLSKA